MGLPLVTPSPGAKHPVPLSPIPMDDPGIRPACNIHYSSEMQTLLQAAMLLYRRDVKDLKMYT